MKNCPFCAEEIQDAAIKCRHCGSAIGPDGGAGPAAKAVAPTAGAPPFAQAAGHGGTHERKTLYDGAPSWRAYFAHYFLGGLATLFVPAIAYKIMAWQQATGGTRFIVCAVLLGIAALYFAGLYLYRKSVRFRVTSSNIETESGILSKKIDVLELWRCRDVRYRQSLLDRILGIAHIELFTADVSTPHLEIRGLPASRQLFEQLRDGIELQRQARNVYGVVS